MDDEIYKAANEFQKLMEYEYKFVVAAKGKSFEVELRFDEYSFHHLCGLHKLNDIIESDTNRMLLFKKILAGSISDEDLGKSRFYISDGVNDRIKRVSELPTLLAIAGQVYKYNTKANPISKINGDVLFKWLAEDGRNIYFVLNRDRYSKNKFFGLSIFSRSQTEKDFAVGHTPNTLLYVSRTPLTKDKQLDKSKEEVLYQRPSYTASANDNIKIVRFAPLSPADGAVVLDSPRATFGQAVGAFWMWIKQFVESKAPKNRRIIKEQKKSLAEKDEEIAALKKENVKLSMQCDRAVSERAEISSELKAAQAELSKTKYKLNNAVELSERRAAVIREVNDILEKKPQLKSDYIKAKKEYRQDDMARKTPPNHKNPPKHKR